jgi:hypothetical protein
MSTKGIPAGVRLFVVPPVANKNVHIPTRHLCSSSVHYFLFTEKLISASVPSANPTKTA